MGSEVDGAIVLMQRLLLAIVETDAVLQADDLFIVKEEGTDG